MRNSLILGCFTAVWAVIVAVSVPGTSHADSQPTPGETKALMDSISKLTEEIKGLKEEVRRLRENLGPTPPGRPPATSGQVTFSDGKKKKFDALSGIRNRSVQGTSGLFEVVKDRVVGSLVLNVRGKEHEVPLADLASFEIGTRDKQLEFDVVLRAKDGRKQTLRLKGYFELEIRWAGEIAIIRQDTTDYYGASFEFDK